MTAVDGHPAEGLSALLDGELEAGEEQVVRAHVARCRRCAEELQWTRATRFALRSLPGVEPPPGAVDLAVERTRADLGAEGGHRSGPGSVTPLHGRRRRAGLAAVAVAASVAAVALATSPLDGGAYRPPLSAAVESHAASLQAMGTVGLLSADGGADPLRPATPVVPTTAPPRDVTVLPPRYPAPEQLRGGYRLVEAFTDPTSPDGLQLLYQRQRYGLSVFQTPGRVDVAALPEPGSRLDVNGAPGWRWEAPEVGGRVVVFERDGLVVIVVGDEPGDAVVDAARSIPPPRPRSLGQRVRELGAEVLEALAP